MTSVPTVRTGRRLGQRLLPYLFVSPFILGVLLYYAYPLGSSLYYSFTQYNVLTPPIWVGLRNYQQLFHDTAFIQGLTNTALYVLFAVPLGTCMGFLQALLLNEKLRGRGLFRALFLVPACLPQIAMASVWLFIWDPGEGLLDNLLTILHLPSQAWIVDPVMVKWMFVSITVWSGIGMLIFLSALQGVPSELYDAAKVDGAGALSRMFNVTLPSITSALLFNLLTGLIGAFQYFTLPMLITQGGPVGGSTFVGQYLYDSAFSFFKMGYASAQAWILFVIIAAIVFMIFRTSARWVYYEA